MDFAWQDWLLQHERWLEAAIGTAAILLAALIAIVIVNRALRRLLRGVMARFHLSYEVTVLIGRSVSIALWICAFLLVLDFWGVGVGGLWTFLVSIAAVIGVGFLAVWTMVSNITASFFITLWRPFRLGQTIELLPEGLAGRVIDRNAMFTVLREADGRTLQIPNNLFFQKMFRVSRADEQFLFEFLETEEHPAAAEQEKEHA